jgi:hypothetical protein
MKLSNIEAMFTGILSFKDFRESISEEIKDYSSSSRTSGKSMPVYLTEDVDLSIGKKELKLMCEAFLNKELSELEINYVADGLLLSNQVIFESEEVSDRFGYLTDPEINGHLTKDAISGILNGLEQ